MINKNPTPTGLARLWVEVGSRGSVTIHFRLCVNARGCWLYQNPTSKWVSTSLNRCHSNLSLTKYNLRVDWWWADTVEIYSITGIKSISFARLRGTGWICPKTVRKQLQVGFDYPQSNFRQSTIEFLIYWQCWFEWLSCCLLEIGENEKGWLRIIEFDLY